MTTPCNQRNTRTALTRTGALAVVFGIAFAPTAAYAGSDPSTVKALIAGDGSVSSVERLPNGEAPSASGIPVKIAISQASEGDVTTTNYQVTNTSVQKKTVEYVGADGLPATMEQDVALPLVAQLAVRLPASRTDVTAFGARITKLSDGSSELVWSMVLFSPIGAPITDVSFSAKGKGEPVARLDVAAVQPNSEPGLSATSQAANATVNGNGILGTVGTGASEGLTKLGEGVGKLLDGLNKLEAGAIKLNTGIVGATDGAEQLAAGGVTASKGATDLAAGAGKVDAGVGKVSDGLASASAGGTKLAAGAAELAPGAAAAAAGAKSLQVGLVLISDGLDQLNDAAGLPAALAGARALRFGVSHAPGTVKTEADPKGLKDPGGLLEVLGSPETDGTILGGLADIRAGLGGPADVADGVAIDPKRTEPPLNAVEGLELIQRGLQDALRDDNAQGVKALAKGATTVSQLLNGGDGVRGGTDGGVNEVTKAACDIVERDAANPIPDPLAAQVDGACDGVEPFLPLLGDVATAVAGGTGKVVTSSQQSLDGVTKIQNGLFLASGGVDLLSAGVTKIRTGVSTGSTKPGQQGLVEGLDALVAGLTKAVGGVAQLAPGAQSAKTGSGALADGTQKIAVGAAAISTGNTALNSGLSQLFTGSKELKAGTGALATGAGKLSDGVKKIADGNKKLADGLPAAADGSGAIAEGLGAVIAGETTVGEGIASVNSQAVAVLQSQFKQGTTLARQQLAGLDAATALAAATPGVQNTTYVLTQSKGDISARLASATSAGGSGSNTARNLGLAAGGVLLLLGGVAGGFVSGRKASVD